MRRGGEGEERSGKARSKGGRERERERRGEERRGEEWEGKGGGEGRKRGIGGSTIAMTNTVLKGEGRKL